eukprot:4768545-Pleurochrysis_carterae.AAC.1
MIYACTQLHKRRLVRLVRPQLPKRYACALNSSYVMLSSTVPGGARLAALTARPVSRLARANYLRCGGGVGVVPLDNGLCRPASDSLPCVARPRLKSQSPPRQPRRESLPRCSWYPSCT